MKKNDVIFYKKAFFLIVKTDKNFAFINKIRTDGIVLNLSQKIPKETKVKVIQGAKKRIKIELPFKTVNDYKYNQFISDAKKCIYYILTNQDLERNKKYLRHLVMRSCMIPVNGHFNTIESFCSKIKLKKPKKLYEFIAKSILEDMEERREVLPSLSDRGLDKVLSNYMTYWQCWHGFDPKLDKVLSKDFAMYMEEFKRRDELEVEVVNFDLE